MKKLSIFLLLSLSYLYSTGQASIKELIQIGIENHDAGEYDKAISYYKQALEQEPNSSLINYEISFSYFKKGDNEKAIVYCDKVLKKNDGYILDAYIIKGSALDMQGKTKESIKLFKKAIKKTEANYLLYFNLALNYYKLGELEDAEANIIEAINNNPGHASSHLMLAKINYKKGNTIPTLLATHFFLLLEPKSARSEDAYAMLEAKFKGNVTKDAENPNSINITISPNMDKEFGAAELTIALLQAGNSLEENEGKSEDELFKENTTSFFTIMGELKKENSKGLWWEFYTPFFYDLSKTEHMEAYCMYISQSGNENYAAWIEDNQPKLLEFDTWLKE